MSKHDCRRCDWKPADQGAHPADQLADHAAETRHWLCRCCYTSLSDEQSDWFACEICLTRARELLSGILTLTDELPHHIGHLGSMRYDSDRPSAKDGPPLPGGDALVLLSPGSYGGIARPRTPKERNKPERWWLLGKTGPLTQAEWMQAERERDGREHQLDNRCTDPSSAAFVLMQLEDDWRHERAEPASMVAGSPSRVMHAAARYLDTFTRWAAQHLEGFEGYLTDLKNLHRRLEIATAQHADEMRSDVGCLECGTKLVRTSVAEPTCTHAQPFPPEHAQCDRGGLRDHYACPVRSCSEQYDSHRYALAAVEQQRDRLREHWVTPEQAQTFLGVKADTVRKWIKRGRIAVDRDRDGKQVVWFDEVETRYGQHSEAC